VSAAFVQETTTTTIIIISLCVVGTLGTLTPTSQYVSVCEITCFGSFGRAATTAANSTTTVIIIIIIIIIELSTSHFIIRVSCRRRPGRRPFDVTRVRKKFPTRKKITVTLLCRPQELLPACTRTINITEYHIILLLLLLSSSVGGVIFSSPFSRSTEIAGVAAVYAHCDDGPSDNSVRRVPIYIILLLYAYHWWRKKQTPKREYYGKNIKRIARKRQNPRFRSQEMERCSSASFQTTLRTIIPK